MIIEGSMEEEKFKKTNANAHILIQGRTMIHK